MCVNGSKIILKIRVQFTRVGTVVSSGISIEHGVYQGSPLGPLLFIICINDIMRMKNSVFCNMYADDTVIVCNDVDVNEAIGKTEIAFKEIQEWCFENKIALNKKKKRHMLVGTGKRKILVADNVLGVTRVDSFTYLGVNIDYGLNFESFLNGTISRVNGRLITLQGSGNCLMSKRVY